MDVNSVHTRISEGPWSRSTIEEVGDILGLGVWLIENGELIGDVMLRWVSAKDRCGEVGYVLHPDHAGNGYATEAVQALIHLAFHELGLHRVIARIDARNAASMKLAERVGMRREAHLVQSHWYKGGWADEVDFAVLKNE